jgi:DNA-binding NarL/FixJ family response regulator
MTISVLLLDDEVLIRSGIRCIIEKMTDFCIIAEVSDPTQAVQFLEKSVPTIITIDINMEMKTGIAIIQRFKHLYPALGIVVLTMEDSEQMVVDSIQAGASAYLLKNVSPAELEIALRAVAHNESYLSPSISTKMIRRFTFPSTLLPNPLHSLTARQLQIIVLIGNRKTNKQIAYELGLSPKTIAAHRTKIMDKIGEKDTVGIVLFARKYGLLSA